MKEIIINSQAEFDELAEIKADESVVCRIELRLGKSLNVYGRLRFERSVDCSFSSRYIVAWGNSSVEAWGNSSVEARENSSVVAWGNSSVKAWGNSSVEARENSSVEARENSSVVAWGNSSVKAWGNSSVKARENSSVEARENSSVEARENSSVVARGNSSVEAWDNSVVRLFADWSHGVKLTLFGFSVCFKPKALKIKIAKKSKTAIIQTVTDLDWFERNGIESKGKVILIKRVSVDFKTQEGTPNETLWAIGSTVDHPKWDPEKGECGGGKFHACSRPYFCDEFRNTEKDDRYIALEIAKKDLFEWKKNPQYPHKIGFRRGKVLYECDRFGKKL